jgi:serine O-acetyltransferase
MLKKIYQPIDTLAAATLYNYEKNFQDPARDLIALPDRDSIIDIIKMLRELLFPGYFGKQYLTAAILENHTGELLINIYDKLNEQMRLSLKRQELRQFGSTEKAEKTANEITFRFLEKIPAVRDILATDIQAAFDGDPAAEDIDDVIISYPGIFAVTVYRLAHELYLLGVPLIPRMMTEYAHNITGIDIHPGARIGKYFFIDHGTGVVIGETSVIGDHVKIYQGVTLGALSTRQGQNLRGTKRHPTLEDHVTVYSGASILGGETVIGRGVTIGSNVFITKSVPNGTKVSAKHLELLFKDGPPQEMVPDWVI